MKGSTRVKQKYKTSTRPMNNRSSNQARLKNRSWTSLFWKTINCYPYKVQVIVFRSAPFHLINFWNTPLHLIVFFCFVFFSGEGSNSTIKTDCGSAPLFTKVGSSSSLLTTPIKPSGTLFPEFIPYQQSPGLVLIVSDNFCLEVMHKEIHHFLDVYSSHWQMEPPRKYIMISNFPWSNVVCENVEELTNKDNKGIPLLNRTSPKAVCSAISN